MGINKLPPPQEPPSHRETSHPKQKRSTDQKTENLSSPILKGHDLQAWKNAYKIFSHKNPQKTQEEFAELILSTYAEEFAGFSPTETAEALLKEYGTTLPQSLLKAAAVIFLGDQETRTIGKPPLTWGTVVRAPSKEGRQEKIRIFSLGIEALGEGGFNTVEKVKGIAFAAKGGEVSTKGLREYAGRTAQRSPTIDDKDLGNETLAKTHQFARSLVSKGRPLPMGVELDSRGRIRGLVKPFLGEQKTQSYLKLYKGGSLSSWVKNEKPTPQLILKTYADAMHGFAALIGFRLLHKDLKPGNIFVDVLPDRTAAKIADFDGVFSAKPLKKDTDAYAVLDELTQYPISSSGISAFYNLHSDYIYLSDLDLKTQEAVRELKNALERLNAIPEENPAPEEEAAVETARLKLIDLRNLMLNAIESLQVFQMSISLYELLAPPDKIVRDTSYVLPLVLSPISDKDIEETVDALHLTDEQSRELKLFFSETIGQERNSRATGKEALNIFFSLEQLL